MAESNLVLENNRNSLILEKLKTTKFDERESMSNMCYDNIPNNYNSVIKIANHNISPTVPVAGTTYKFPIDSICFLKKLVLEVTLVRGAGDYVGPNTTNLGCLLFKKIKLVQSGNRVLFENNPGYLLCRIEESNYTKQQLYNNITSILPDETTNVIQIPLFSYFTDHIVNNILLDTTKNLEVICEYNNELTFDPALTSMDVKLVMYRTCYENEQINYYRKTAFSKPSLNFLGYGTSLTKLTLANGSSSRTVDISNKMLLQSIHTAIFKYPTAETVAINSIDIQLGDKYIVKDLTKNLGILNIQWGPDELSENDIVVANSTTTSFSYFFGKQRRLMHSGSLDASMTPVYLTINYDTLDASAELYINLEYMNVITLETQTGTYNSGIVH
jgi:uncharacterized membrane protein